MSMDEAESDQNLDGDELDPQVVRLDLFLKKLFQSNKVRLQPSEVDLGGISEIL